MKCNRSCFDDVGIIALVNDVWGETWRSRHQILTRLGRYFNVLWCNPAASWRTFGLCRDPPSGGIDHGGSTIPAFTVYQPERWLPNVGRPPFLARLTSRSRLKRAKQILIDKHGCTKFVLYLWHPHFASALNLLDYDVSCYHIVDEYTYSDIELPFDEAEKRLISEVDQVFIHSPGLMEKKGTVNPNTSLVPNGVDFATFARPAEEPHDIRSIPHPRIGYSGIVKRTLDWPLLEQLFLRHPEWQFVFVGQINPCHPEILDTVQELSNRPNVHFLGSKIVREFAVYPQHFDVCIMPYLEKSHSFRYGYPLKLHEYLASGRPAVGSPILTLQDFDHVIKLARTPDEWSQAIRDSLLPYSYSQPKVELRRKIARQHDWDKLTRIVADTLCANLSRKGKGVKSLVD